MIATYPPLLMSFSGAEAMTSSGTALNMEMSSFDDGERFERGQCRAFTVCLRVPW